jgi:hypothetical protein
VVSGSPDGLNSVAAVVRVSGLPSMSVPPSTTVVRRGVVPSARKYVVVSREVEASVPAASVSCRLTVCVGVMPSAAKSVVTRSSVELPLEVVCSCS